MRTRGFTLIELITVLVLLGVGVVGVATLLRSMADIYLAQNEREQLLSESRFVLERLSRELRDAVPNSLRVSNNGLVSCVEFVPFTSVVRYRNLPLQPDPQSVIEVVSLAGFTASSGQLLLVNPLSVGDVYGNTLQKAQLQSKSQPDSNQPVYRLQLNQPTAFASGSVARRLYLLDAPVSYCALGGEIRRYQNYNLQSSQPLPGSGLNNGALMAQQVRNDLNAQPVFVLAEPGLTRNSMLRIELVLASDADADTLLTYSQLVQVSNVP